MLLTATSPDILEVISDLSNDEVFTPPKVANRVLDLLPEEIWRDPTTRFLDPGSKTGVFLREITRRLMIGLADRFPDEDQRLDHILRNMVWGLAITELTSFMSRRTLYCSKNATSPKSVVTFDNPSGNIWFETVDHAFVNGRCSECSAPESIQRDDRDNYAYGFIHQDGKEKIERSMGMKFDVIVGNPPYQMEADAEGQNVVPLYNTFVKEAIALNPRYITMVIPSRWVAGGKYLDEFRTAMLRDKRVRQIVDFPNGEDVFPGVGKNIKGGVMYFLWSRDDEGSCRVTTRRGETVEGPVERHLDEFDVFVRDIRALPILKKVLSQSQDSFADLVSTRDPFGPALASNFKAFRRDDTKQNGDLRLYMNDGNTRVARWVDPAHVTKNFALVQSWKVLVPKAYGAGESVPHQILGQPIVAEPESACTVTYLVAGPFSSKSEAVNAEKYMKTRFFRFLVSLRKISQNSTQKVFSWVPVQDFSKSWTDDELYEAYGITADEQAYIDSMIKEMA
jgi:site-specific DNA-methyltransferase (adenine-specific)